MYILFELMYIRLIYKLDHITHVYCTDFVMNFKHDYHKICKVNENLFSHKEFLLYVIILVFKTGK